MEVASGYLSMAERIRPPLTMQGSATPMPAHASSVVPASAHASRTTSTITGNRAASPPRDSASITRNAATRPSRTTPALIRVPPKSIAMLDMSCADSTTRPLPRNQPWNGQPVPKNSGLSRQPDDGSDCEAFALRARRG
jgi:hypothetical protein